MKQKIIFALNLLQNVTKIAQLSKLLRWTYFSKLLQSLYILVRENENSQLSKEYKSLVLLGSEEVSRSTKILHHSLCMHFFCTFTFDHNMNFRRSSRCLLDFHLYLTNSSGFKISLNDILWDKHQKRFFITIMVLFSLEFLIFNHINNHLNFFGVWAQSYLEVSLLLRVGGFFVMLMLYSFVFSPINVYTELQNVQIYEFARHLVYHVNWVSQTTLYFSIWCSVQFY